jgi:hypothetical protein
MSTVTTASKQPAQFKEPIPERGVLLSVQRTISRDENGPPHKIMALEIGGSMVKNIPENAAARASSDDDRAEKRHFSGQLPHSVAAMAAGLGSSTGAASRAKGRDASELEDLSANGLSLCVSGRNDKNMRNVDFGDAIGKELQNLYDDLVAQPVPDRFLNLLNQLEKNMISSGLSSSAPGERE